MHVARVMLLVTLTYTAALAAACRDDDKNGAVSQAPAPPVAAAGRSVTAAATPSGPPQITLSLQPSAAMMTPGMTVTVELRAALAPGVELGAWTFELSYDATRLQPTECTAIQSGTALCNIAPVSGPPRITTTGASTGGIAGEVTLASITIGVAPGAAPGPTPLTLTIAGTTTDAEVHPLSVSPASGAELGSVNIGQR